MNNNVLKLEMVSDVSCPWCIIAYYALEQALNKLPSAVAVDLTWLPFEINPRMAKEGQPVQAYLAEKYGMSSTQQSQNIAQIEARGRAVGFIFKPLVERHVYNSFDCHRLLSLASEKNLATPLKKALLHSYFEQGEDISDHQILTEVASGVGLNQQEIKSALTDDELAQRVTEHMEQVKALGITSVPMLIINNKYGVSGAQTPERYFEILTQVLQGE